MAHSISSHERFDNSNNNGANDLYSDKARDGRHIWHITNEQVSYERAVHGELKMSSLHYETEVKA